MGGEYITLPLQTGPKKSVSELKSERRTPSGAREVYTLTINPF